MAAPEKEVVYQGLSVVPNDPPVAPHDSLAVRYDTRVANDGMTTHDAAMISTASGGAFEPQETPAKGQGKRKASEALDKSSTPKRNAHFVEDWPPKKRVFWNGGKAPAGSSPYCRPCQSRRWIPGHPKVSRAKGRVCDGQAPCNMCVRESRAEKCYYSKCYGRGATTAQSPNALQTTAGQEKVEIAKIIPATGKGPSVADTGKQYTFGKEKSPKGADY